MIEFKHTSLTYPYDEYAVLKDLNFTLTDGINTVLCDSQSGKTSICKLLIKEFAPTGGQIFVDGRDIIGITNQSLGILYLPSVPVFFENRSVIYNVTYPLKARKVDKSNRLTVFNEIIRQADMPDSKIKVKKLTLAERKQVALIRGLTVKRRIVLLDDFCDDAEQLDKVISLFPDVTIVVFSSDVNFARGNVIVLDGGRSVYQGDVSGAIECKQKLNWIVDMLRSE